MMNCSKCGNEPQETDMFGWKCTSCDKVYSAKLSYLRTIQERKKSGNSPLMKCKECGEPLDNGEEMIIWKCSCGNAQIGILEDYVEKISSGVTSNLISCPDCGYKVSKRAEKCPHCGCPLSEMITSGVVKIKLPRTEQMADGLVGLLSSKVTSITSGGKTLWIGKHGETASFTIDEPTPIVIYLGGWGNPVKGTVEPKKRYELIQDYGFHLFATFRLSEVDIIDSGM